MYILTTLSSLLALTSLAHANDKIVFGAFLKYATYSIASDYNLFAANGLDVEYAQIPNSTYGYAQLLNGNTDIVLAAFDNVINRRWNSGLPLTILGQLDVDEGFAIAATPSVTSVQQLKGKVILVDSPVSGFSYLVEKILSLYGLNMAHGDYFFQAVGGSDQRYAALLNGTYNGTEYATLLTWPFTEESTFLTGSNKPNILLRSSDLVYPYVDGVFTVRNESLTNATMRSKFTRLLRAFYQADQILANPANKQCVEGVIQKQFHVSDAVAEVLYADAADPTLGETSSVGRNFTVSIPGAVNVISARSEFGGWSSNITEAFSYADALVPGPGQLIDYSIRDAAIANFTGSCEIEC